MRSLETGWISLLRSRCPSLLSFEAGFFAPGLYGRNWAKIRQPDGKAQNNETLLEGSKRLVPGPGKAGRQSLAPKASGPSEIWEGLDLAAPRARVFLGSGRR